MRSYIYAYCRIHSFYPEYESRFYRITTKIVFIGPQKFIRLVNWLKQSMATIIKNVDG